MNHTEALMVLRKLAAYQPEQRVDDMTAEVFADGLAAHDVRDALDAVTTLCTAPRRVGEPWLVAIRDILTEVRRVEAEREKARMPLYAPPASVADDPAAYQRWLADTARACRGRDWAAPPAIEATRPHPAIQRAVKGLPLAPEAA